MMLVDAGNGDLPGVMLQQLVENPFVEQVAGRLDDQLHLPKVFIVEPVERGIYTGSIGYFDFNGDMDLNIVIRTLVLQKNKGYIQVGAGIVYDSVPAREYEETLHKGEAMAQALIKASL